MAVGSVGAVSDLFASLEQLQQLSLDTSETHIQGACQSAITNAERVVECLEFRTREYNTAKNDVEIISEWLRRAVYKLVKVRREVLQLEEEKKFARDIKLAEAGIDPRPLSAASDSLTMKHSTSYESFKLKKLSGSTTPTAAGGSVRSAASSPQPTFGIRKVRSDPDVNMHNMQKEVESLKIDNQRLKGSEKKLLKDTLHLGRKCRVLEEEKNRAENRLMIEQTQRDSTEKLRQRNRELEQQVQKLKQQHEVIKQKDEEENN